MSAFKVGDTVLITPGNSRSSIKYAGQISQIVRIFGNACHVAIENEVERSQYSLLGGIWLSELELCANIKYKRIEGKLP